ncbi:MAG TPA: GPP34 family phosphoprotein [Actinocrinis sp.]|nr:GPP34 family phosphoprotein [Actinocrinis sp.]
MEAPITGRLADDFFLMAHEESSGKPRLAERIAGLGLAAALLGELVLAGRIELREGTVAVLESGPCDDVLSGRVLDFLKQEQHPTRTWLTFFSQSAHTEVARRLVADGSLTRETRKRPWQSGRWLPVSPKVATRPTALLCTQLIRGHDLDRQDLLLVGLLRVTGLDQPVLWEVRHSAPDALRRAGALLGSLGTSFTELITQTEAAVGSAIATHRF